MAERSIDLVPADVLAPSLPRLDGLPKVWRLCGGVPRECYVVGVSPDGVAVILVPYEPANPKKPDDHWGAQTTMTSALFRTRDEAALHGLGEVQAQLAKIAATLTQVADAAVGVLKKKS